MLDPQEVADYITDKLNKKAQLTPAENGWYPTFSLLAEVSEGHEHATVEGMLVTMSEDILPVLDGFKQVLYTYRAQFFFSSLTNDEYLDNKKIIESVIAENQSKELVFTTGKGIITFNGGTPGKTFGASSYGAGVQYEFTVSVAYTENAVSSAQKHWLLDGNEIPFLSESVTVETEGIPRKIFTEVYTKALITGKTKFYTFRIPYESETYKKLQQEIMSSAHIDVVHTLSYYDGAAFTQENPFTAKVSIHRSASSASQRPNGSAYEVTFSDVYSGEGQRLKYSIALIDFPFDMNGEDTRYFNSTDEQFAYFEGKAAGSSAPFVEIMAPNLDNLVITQQVYYNANRSGITQSAFTQFDYANKNYAIVKVEETSGSKAKRHYYYFIQKATIGAGGYVLCDLKLDTVQTYFFRPDVTFSDCLIERAHLDRFEPVPNDPTRVQFVSDPASKIFNSEDGLNFPKRLVSRGKLQLSFTGIPEVDEWLNANIAYWVYIFISPSSSYSVAQINGKAMVDLKEEDLGRVKYPIGFDGVTNCLCYPIYKNAKLNKDNPNIIKNAIIVRAINEDTTFISALIPCYYGRKTFEENNNKSSYYYSIKISIIPPFSSIKPWNIDNEWVDNNGNLCIRAKLKLPTDLYLTEPAFIRTSKTDSVGLFWGANQEKTFFATDDIYLTENEPILISKIVKKQPPQLSFNPKLNGQNFKELIITASSGDTFTYDIQKLVESEIGFEYTEPITPEITKYYFRVAGGTGLYEEWTDNNYTGLVGSTDNGLAFANEAYAAFIANNKNFYLQSNLKIGAQVVSSSINSGISAAAGDWEKAISGTVGSVFQAGIAAIDRSLTVDNMKNAPDQLKNANGNVIFNLFSVSDTGTELGLYFEKYSALEGDLKTANDFMDLYGFSFNSVANVKDYANKREYHSYVKAQLQSINGNLNNITRDDLRQRFANGVRFWNSDTVRYDMENFEHWLLEAGVIIKFYVAGEFYYAEKGSTWEQFVNSSYNDGGFFISGQEIRCTRNDTTYVVYDGFVHKVLPKNPIVAGRKYNLVITLT